MGTGKPKIQKTCRIRLRVGASRSLITVYCSCDIIREVREGVMRFQNNVMIPQKGKTEEVFSKLIQLAKQMPDHFPGSSRSVINYYAGETI